MMTMETATIRAADHASSHAQDWGEHGRSEACPTAVVYEDPGDAIRSADQDKK